MAAPPARGAPVAGRSVGVHPLRVPVEEVREVDVFAAVAADDGPRDMAEVFMVRDPAQVADPVDAEVDPDEHGPDMAKTSA